MLLNDGDCAHVVLPSDLVGIMQVRPFYDQVFGINYCVALDHKDSDNNGKWDYGFFLLITPDRRYDLHRRIHFSSQHTVYETSTGAQNVKLFQSVGANSALVNGLHQSAKLLPRSSCHSGQYPTDAMEDNNPAFHVAFVAIWNVSNQQSWDPYYLQFHGTVACSGSANDIFITNGFGTCFGSQYANATYYPVGGMATLLRDHIKANSTWAIDHGGNNTCQLTHSTNVAGRVVNGVGVDSVCGTEATYPANKFFAFEQRVNPRNSANQAPWIDAIKTRMPYSCAPGRSFDYSTKMCV
jgi:hypothetical protein